jgi:hypothetical protein
MSNVGNPYAVTGGQSLNPFEDSNGGGVVTQNSGMLSNYNGPFSGDSILGQPFSWLIGLLLILVFLKWFSEHPDTSIKPYHLHIGGYDIVSVGLISIVVIALFKLIFTRWQVMGLSQLANYV